MPQFIDRSALVWHSSERMRNLVNDVEAYPNFLPFCKGAEVVSRSGEEVVATLELEKAGVSHRFTTRNCLRTQNTIRIELLDGPFKTLRGDWEFKPLQETACKVILRLEFELHGAMEKLAPASLLSQVANALVDAFCNRANVIYGNQSN